MASTPAELARGEAAYRSGNYDEAIALLAKALEEDPTNPRVSCFLGLAWWRKGSEGSAEPTIQHLTRAWELAGQLPILSEDPSLELLTLARAYYKKQDYQSTILWVERGIARDPNRALLHDLLGDAWFGLKEYEKAATSYHTAVELDPDHKAWSGSPGVIHKGEASALFHLRRYREALAAIDEAIRFEQGCAAYHNWKGYILGYGLKDLDGAISAVRKALDLDPGYVGAVAGLYHYNLAGFLADQGRYDEALVFANKAFALNPSDADYRARQQKISDSAKKLQPGAAGGLRTFADIGGMKQLKEEIRRALYVIHVARDKAKAYRIQKNGILLYGPPGCGKTVLAEAIAGEFGLRFIRVSTAAMLSKWSGEGAKNVEKVFEDAVLQVPCVLFFDECEALLTRREDRSDVATVDAFLQAVDKYRPVPSLVIVAATNHLDALDKAAIREGRFDYKIKIYKPDFEARLELFKVKLKGRPTADDIDFFPLADKTDGFSAARISQVVNNAAMDALEENAPISQRHLGNALEAEIGKDRFEGRRLTWDELILSPETMAKLRFIGDALVHPQHAAALGIRPPSGLLLHGPPGTGKTTIARVLASELKASFYLVTPADVYSKWAGESERRVKEIFEKARDNRPSIVFMDEIDAILSRRDGAGERQWRNSIVNLFLMEIDGLSSVPGVFVLGATNRRELLDEALLRPGRLSEQIEIPLPSEEERVRLFRLFSRKMTMDAGVDLERLAADTADFSGAEIESLCSNAGRNALVRVLETQEQPSVRSLDFAKALQERKKIKGKDVRRPMGFGRT